MSVVRLRDAKPNAIVLLSLWQAVMTCEACPAYQRLKVLYDATCATYRTEHIAHYAWTADDNGKMVLTPAGVRALEHYSQLLAGSSAPARETNQSVLGVARCSTPSGEVK
jgi:hypothetical protein